MDHLTGLPPEILHHIFQWLEPLDLGALLRVCKGMNFFVRGNRKLHQDCYLNYLDTPEDTEVDWIKQLQNVGRLQVVGDRKAATSKRDDLEFVHDTVTYLLKHASSLGHTIENSATHQASKNASLVNSIFKQESNREAFLQRSFLFERVRNETLKPVRFPEEPFDRVHQMSARLHCLYGKAILNVGRLRSSKTYPYACSKVYDLRQYTHLTGWGPFMDDETDRVDWEKVEAILIVVGHNIYTTKSIYRIFSDIFDTPFAGSWPNSYRSPSPAQSISDTDLLDPYGVTGTWYQIVCFLDYNDFFEFNFPTGGDDVGINQPRRAINVGEATRLIVMRIHTTAVEPPGPEDGQALPVVHFRGVSRSLDDYSGEAGAEVGGTVRLTREGEVRWTTFSIFHGQERWRSEGVQIGGVKSARGVAGNWFDRDYDPHGPAGPTIFWKATDVEDQRWMVHNQRPNDFFTSYNSLLDFQEGSDGESTYDPDDNEEQDEEDLYFEPETGEVTGLLADALVDVVNVPAEDH